MDIMKRFINYLNLFILGIMCMNLTACSDDSAERGNKNISVTVFSPTRVVPGETVTIVGTGLDKVETVVFADNNRVTEIEVTNENQIKVKIPSSIGETTSTITLEGEGQAVTTDAELTIIMPQITAYTPLEINAGDELELTGTDLQHISAITFPGDITVNAVDFIRKSENILHVQVPIDIPTCSETLTITTNGGGIFESAVMNFIERPEGEWVEEETTVWDYTTHNGGTPLQLTWGSGLDGAKSEWFEGIELGDEITIYFNKNAGATDGYMLKLYYGNWNSITEVNDETGNGDPNAAIDVQDRDSFTFSIFSSLLSWFRGDNGDKAMIVTGNNITLTKITWTHKVWKTTE